MVSVPMTWSDKVETSGDVPEVHQDGMVREFSTSLADMPDIPWPFDGVQRSQSIPSSVRPYPDGFSSRWSQSWYPLDDLKPCWSADYTERSWLTADPFGWLTGPCQNPLPTRAHPEGYPSAALDELRWSETRQEALRQRIAHLEATVAASDQDRIRAQPSRPTAGDQATIETVPLEFEVQSGEMRGVSIKNLVVRATDAAGASQGWRVGDQISRLNGYPLYCDEDLETALVYAQGSYRLAGKAPVFEIRRR